MDSVLENKLLKYNVDTLVEIRKNIGINTQEEMKKAIEILEEWIQKQDHFKKKDFSKHRLEMLLVCSKGSIERAKSRLDKLCTLKTLLPQYFGDFDVDEDFKDINCCSLRVVLPKMTKDNSRVSIIKIFGEQMGNDVLSCSIRSGIMYLEYLFSRDYFKQFIFVFDCSETNLVDLATKLYPTILHHGSSIFMQSFGVRIKEIHVISSSKLIETIVTIFKTVLTDKVADRLQIHKNIESVYKHVPQDLFPEDYGGKEKTTTILQDEWNEVLRSEKTRAYIKEMSEARTDESLRSKDKFNNDYMGMPGTFRTLSVD